MRYFVLVVFLVTYLLFFLLHKRRALVAAVSSVILISVGGLISDFGIRAALLSINWNVMGIFIGTLVLAELFTYSRAPAVLAEKLVNRSTHVGFSILLICILSSVISAFVENVATVLIVAPVTFAICNKVRINPVIPIIGIAISSNLQGTATLIGDPPSMLLAGYAKLTFNDFFIYRGRPGIFFTVQIGAVFSFMALWLFFRPHRQNVTVERTEKVRVWMPVILLSSMVVLLALSSFADPDFNYFAGLICIVLGFFGFLWYVGKEKKPGRRFLAGLDWETTVFLAGIFILVGALTEFGWIDVISKKLSEVIGSSRLLAFSTIVLGSIAISAVVDNVPYLATMIPVAQKMAENLMLADGASPADQTLLLFGLLIGSCLGGNITPVGAAANIVGVGLLKKRGHDVSFGQFIRVGLPFTIAAVVPSAIFLWLVWAR